MWEWVKVSFVFHRKTGFCCCGFSHTSTHSIQVHLMQFWLPFWIYLSFERPKNFQTYRMRDRLKVSTNYGTCKAIQKIERHKSNESKRQGFCRAVVCSGIYTLNAPITFQPFTVQLQQIREKCIRITHPHDIWKLLQTHQSECMGTTNRITHSQG